MRRLPALALALLAIALPASAAASDSPATQATSIAKAGPHSVRVTVKVPGDLAPGDVQASMGSSLAAVESVHRVGAHRPLHLVLAIDTSQSMSGKPLTGAVAAGRRLIDAVGSGDRVGLVTFDGDARVVAPLSPNGEGVGNALSVVQTAEGTSLYDGVLAAVKLAGSNPDARRVVVVLSDGDDTTSQATLDDALAAAAGSGVEIDAVGLTSSPSFTPTDLQQIAAASSGRLVTTDQVAGLEPLMAALTADRLSSEYAIDIALPHSSAHALTVSVKGAQPAKLALPAGVSSPSYSSLHTYGGWAVTAAGALAIGLIGFLLLAWWAARPQTLGARLAPYSADRSKRRTVRGRASDDFYEALQDRLEGRWLWKRLHSLCARAGVTSPTGRVLVIIAACGVAAALVASALLGLLFAVVAFAAGVCLPVAVLRSKATRRKNAFEAQLPELLGVWASALRAGRSFAQALDTIVEEAADPALSEFRRAQQQVRLGVPVEQALDEMAGRLGSESFELVVLTTDVQRRIGGNVAEIFDQVSETVRKRQQFAARVRALTAMGVMSARVLLAMPFAIAAMLTLVNAGYMAPLYVTTTGHILIGISLVMMGIGALVLRRMVRPRAIA
jgi:tight adherence protein B